MKLFIYNDNSVKQWIVVLDDKPAMTAGYDPEELQKLGRFVAEKIMTHSKKAMLEVEYGDTQNFINGLGPKKKPVDDHPAVFCEHANEVPAICECEALCYCRSHTCKWRKM